MSKSQRNGFIQLILVIAFIAGGLVINRLMQTRYEPVSRHGGGDRALFVDTTIVNPAPYQIVFDTTGTVTARADINIVPQVTGRVIEVDEAFYNGGVFGRDQTLFQIDPRDYELDTQRLAAEVARAQTTLDLESAEATAALAEWAQINGTRPSPDLVARRPQLAEAQANLAAAHAALANAELALSRTRYTLPFAGRVVSSRIAPGQFVQAGQNYGTSFDLAALEVIASVEGKKLEWLLASPQATVQITAEYLGQSHTYEGVLKRGAASLDPVTRFATVRFGFKSPSVDLLPGVFTHVTINGPRHDNISEVPASALQQEGIIWLVDADQTLRIHQPDILYADTSSLALRNLPSGSVVVTSRVSGASAGVRITQSDDATTATAASTPTE